MIQAKNILFFFASIDIVVGLTKLGVCNHLSLLSMLKSQTSVVLSFFFLTVLSEACHVCTDGQMVMDKDGISTVYWLTIRGNLADTPNLSSPLVLNYPDCTEICMR